MQTLGKVTILRETPGGGAELRSPDQAHTHYTTHILTDPIFDPDKETVIAYILNAKLNLTHIDYVSTGILDASLVHAREIFRKAILLDASAIVVCHNHPSGDPTPSVEDIRSCRGLAKASEIIGIELLDFIVFGKDGFFSFRERGMLEAK
jgi:DNA repair protein RadC